MCVEASSVGKANRERGLCEFGQRICEHSIGTNFAIIQNPSEIRGGWRIQRNYGYVRNGGEYTGKFQSPTQIFVNSGKVFSVSNSQEVTGTVKF